MPFFPLRFFTHAHTQAHTEARAHAHIHTHAQTHKRGKGFSGRFQRTVRAVSGEQCFASYRVDAVSTGIKNDSFKD